MKTGTRVFSVCVLVEGLFALYALLRVPSESGALFGYSLARLALGGLLLAGIALAALFAVHALRWTPIMQRLFDRLSGSLRLPGQAFWLAFGLAFTAGLCLLLYLFTYLVYPPHLRGLIAWVGLAALQALVLLFWYQRIEPSLPDFWQPFAALPHWERLDPARARVLGGLLVVGLVYFLLFAIPNTQGAGDLNEMQRTTGDEFITYAPLTWMLLPSETPEAAVYHWFIYEDYHYGYLFYLLSALAVLPSRLLYGADFATHTQLNLLLLRQMVSVLPVILTALVLTFLQTRFRGWWRSLVLFALLLTIPQVVSYNIRFWHPDGLVALMCALTLFFLDRDQARFGLPFYLAAVTCGLAAGIKLWGFFFFLAVGGLLLYGWLAQRRTFAFIFIRGLGFLLVMLATILLSNPYLLVPQARERMVSIMTDLSGDVTSSLPGSDAPDAAEHYRTGLAPTADFLEIKYGSRWFLLLLGGSLLAAGLWGEQKRAAWLTLAWVLPVVVYLTFFLPYKSYHYWMAVLLPLYSGALALSPAALNAKGRTRLLSGSLFGLLALAVAAQFAANLLSAASDWAAVFSF